MRIFRHLVRLLRDFGRDYWPGSGPKSLLDLAREPRPRTALPTSKLYVVEVDFAVDPVAYGNLESQLAGLREKYGLDFLIVEPGFKLKRFDDY